MRTCRHKEALFYGCADCKVFCPKIISGGITSHLRKHLRHHVGQPCWPVRDEGLLWVQKHPDFMFGFGPLDVSAVLGEGYPVLAAHKESTLPD